MDQTAAVGPARNRIDLLDALRGFALLGILLVNIRSWSGWFSLEPAQRDALAGGAESTWWHQFLVTAVLEGKFYTIFSFLFGLGFALQLSRLERRGAAGVSIYRRRLLILLGLGVLHMSLLWDGDILTLYALLGLLLPFFRDWSDRRLVTAAMMLILLPIPGFALVHTLGVQPDLGLPNVGDRLFVILGGDPALEKLWPLREDWASFFAWTLSGPPFRVGDLIQSWRLPKVLAIMLLGLWAGRRLVDGRLLEDRQLLRRIALIGFAIGIPANVYYGFIGGLEQQGFRAGLVAHSVYAVGVVPLALAYAASFALLWPRLKSVMEMFAAPGRMALTNYLSQTVLGLLIFYGVGFGLYRSMSPWAVSAVALAIFVTQIIWSRVWLRYFAQGPMEALWRRLTYGRREKPTDEAALSS